jgi:hypothetical protein
MLNVRTALVKMALLGIPIFLSACCLEEGAGYKWDIVNNSSDTIFITSASSPFPDSIAVLPHQTFTEANSSLGKDKNFYCTEAFQKNEVVVSGDKILTKTLEDSDNWIQSSENSRCSMEHNCRFVIEQTDIE